MTVLPGISTQAVGPVGRQRTAAYGVCRHADGRVPLPRAAPTTCLSDQWFLPGGGLGFGEAPEDVLARELVAETGLTVSIAARRTGTPARRSTPTTRAAPCAAARCARPSPAP
ncbi:NUDIX domain-containing protein [Frankia sp. CiP3]|uniref:NUDIX domain-containing protein n=1 Tax=Frankia sp. CiP3 TaxID=2880971 RepID=UPI001EF3F447|nr:NUDIX domain-containing protein [Frankia sp. CiP3]